ncbi:MAG: hypothetical protein QOJ76_1341 [Acidobacteriota bacterium]|jgi:hypothetical protein|nr:hypothetical protein [Acidobacteriota bacterium]
MKKISFIACLAAALLIGSVAASIFAQKKSDDRAAQHGDVKHADDGNMKHAGDGEMKQAGGDMNHADCPLMHGDKAKAAGAGGHEAHLAAVNARGEKAMGFSQTETTHHFILREDGGLIQVEANGVGDAESRDKIRRHLAHVAQMFAGGDFDTPLLVHERVPPGVPVMERLKAEINYIYEETATGGRVRISTKNVEALAAIHDFLRFQITEHRTGDSPAADNR